MGMSTLTQLLQGFCSDGVWRYAVFWAFKNERNGILTWGDGYVKKMIEDSQMGGLCAGPVVGKNQIISSACCNKSYQLCPIEAALLRMPGHSYLLGEDIIGKVALTGQYSWLCANELWSTSIHKYLEDWQLQFAAGIKTVLLVPVIPHGVLQLGSLDMVFESSALVALIKDLFHELYDPSVSHNTLRQPTAKSIDPQDVLPHDLIAVIESSAQLLNVDQLSLPHSFTASEFPVLEDVTIDAYRTSLTGGPNGPLHYEHFDGFTLTDMEHGYKEHTHSSTIVLNDNVVITNSSIHSGFQKGLEAMSREEHEFFMWHSGLKQEEPTSHALLQVNGHNADFYLQLETNNYAELLLDTIIDQIGHTSNCESSRSTDSPFSCETRIKKDHAVRLDESSVPDLQGGQELSAISMNEGFMSSEVTDTSPMEINKIITDVCMGHRVQDAYRINSAEIKRGCRKVELQRPRPRDRQLVQDRMNGLRELIPNASKCSIDALLDKTITYMLFLRSVSEKAEKVHNTLVDEKSRDETKKQLENCPLRVEELDQPGHLLIEILCEDYELFLKMAHVLKGLEVSILKGVLEHRSDKLWARFVIEVYSEKLAEDITTVNMHYVLKLQSFDGVEVRGSDGSSKHAGHGRKLWLTQGML